MGDRFSSKLLILGLDGVDWQLLEPLILAGVMPNLARLRHEGAWGPLTSVIPTQSATAWASFITGQNPARHGVFDFMVRQPDGTYRHAKPHPSTTLWSHLGAGGLQVGVVNFPVTFPPDPVNGILVSGMLTPKGRTFTHPPSLGDEMLAAVPGYQLDLEWELYKGRDRALLRDLSDMTRHQVEALRFLRGRYDPDAWAIAFVGTDRLQHGFMRCLDPAHPGFGAADCSSLTDPIHGFYALLDQAVGELVSELPDGATVFALSDHGFQRTVWQFRVDDWLAQHGWLARTTGRSRVARLVRRLDTPWVRHLRRRLVKDVSRHFSLFSPGGTLDWSRTVASSAWTRQQGIRLNVRGRDPQGIVAPGAEYERLRDAISAALLQTTEPTTGEPVVVRVWRREELYAGPFYEMVPDLVFALRPDFTASPVQQGLWTPTGWASGDHSLEGMFIAWGRAIAPGRVEGAALIDIAPTALYLLDQPVPFEMDGRVLLDALDAGFVAAHPVRRGAEQTTYPVEGPPQAVALTAEEEADVAARLRGLGYL